MDAQLRKNKTGLRCRILLPKTAAFVYIQSFTDACSCKIVSSGEDSDCQLQQTITAVYNPGQLSPGNVYRIPIGRRNGFVQHVSF